MVDAGLLVAEHLHHLIEAFELADHRASPCDTLNIGVYVTRVNGSHTYIIAFDKAAKANALLIEGGLERRPVTPEEIRQIEPTLKGSYYGGFFTPSDSTGDIHKFTRGLADACARHGVRFYLRRRGREDRSQGRRLRGPLAARGARP